MTHTYAWLRMQIYQLFGCKLPDSLEDPGFSKLPFKMYSISFPLKDYPFYISRDKFRISVGETEYEEIILRKGSEAVPPNLKATFSMEYLHNGYVVKSYTVEVSSYIELMAEIQERQTNGDVPEWVTHENIHFEHFLSAGKYVSLTEHVLMI